MRPYFKMTYVCVWTVALSSIFPKHSSQVNSCLYFIQQPCQDYIFLSFAPATGLVNVLGTEDMTYLNTLALHIIY